MKLLLASKSPRRRDLLSRLGFPLSFVDLDVDEVVPPGTPVDLIPAGLALLKAKAFSKPLASDEILVTADTIVAHRGDMIGKPHSREEAIQMLQSLSGDRHTVFTGVCLKSAKRQCVFTEKTYVWFRQLSLKDIISYVDSGSCMDKAGAYGIQEWIGLIGVERIEGCFYNVMGLPVSRLYQELCKGGW